MRKSKLFKQPKFNHTFLALLLTVGVGIGIILPAALTLASYRAKILAARAQKEANLHPNQALIDYRVANTLSPTNHTINQNLAALYVKLNRPDDAISTLQKLPIGESGVQIATVLRLTGRLEQAQKILNELNNAKPEVLLLKSQILLEQGSTKEATLAAQQALKFYPASPRSQLQLGLCQAVGEQTTDLNDLIATVVSPQTLQGLKQAQQGKTALAYVLYAGGLLRSSKAVLLKQPDLYATELQLLGRINLELAKNDPSKLPDAQTALIKATQADPANLDNHRLLKQVYDKMGNKDKAAHQENLLKQLESGKV